ncbi:MAG: hypothetical protein GEV11_19475 [Streptosporangiales bacterium]|nr:hypothetical protein [Streptosporangiales bacterium]
MRARELGVEPGLFPPGTLNAITDVAGVRVGHVTLHRSGNVRTGVTAILPHDGNLFQEKVAGAAHMLLDPDGSCMIVVATDAPLDARNLERLGARAVFGLGRTGSSYSNGSGDYAIAFSTTVREKHGETAPRDRTLLPNDAVSPLFQAALEATEEAVYNALFMATATTGNGTTVEAVPLDEVARLLKKYGRGR